MSGRRIEDGGAGPGEGELEALLRRRAERLSRPRAEPGPSRAGEALTFLLGGETYGIALPDLSGAMPLAGLAPVPGWPPELLGVVNRRGTLTPVLDARRLLGLGRAAGDGGEAVLFLRPPRPAEQRMAGPRMAGPRAVGLRVDALGEIRPLPEGASAPDPGASPLVQAVSHDGLILLSARRILALDLLGGPDAPRP